MASRYAMQKLWNDGRRDLMNQDLNVQFTAITQCLFDMSETLALIYDKLDSIQTKHSDSDDFVIGLPI